MRVTLSTPIIVSTESGDVSCTEAEASIAISNSVAIRLVPVVGGEERPDFTVGVVGTDEIDTLAFMVAVRNAAEALLINRGI